MAQLAVKLDPERLEALRRYAAHRRTPVDWLIKDYVDYLLHGGAPVPGPELEDLSANDLAAATQAGGAFNWLAEEPELYTVEDGEPV